MLPIIWIWGDRSLFIMLPWLTIPLALPLLRLMRSGQGRALNLGLRGTARLHMIFGLLLALGLLL